MRYQSSKLLDTIPNDGKFGRSVRKTVKHSAHWPMPSIDREPPQNMHKPMLKIPKQRCRQLRDQTPEPFQEIRWYLPTISQARVFYS